MKKHLLDYISDAKSHSVRGLRILVEYFYALEIFEPTRHLGIPIVSVFGSARLKPGKKEYEDAKKLGRLLYENGYAVVTGASQGIMEAANLGVVEGLIAEFKSKHKRLSEQKIRKLPEFQRQLHGHSLGLKISLPFEPSHNPHLGVVATFHYFMVRKFFFANLSSAFIACEGGWGTRDELFEILTLVQTGKAPLMPIIYISPDPKHLQYDLDYALKKNYISPEDLELLQIVSNYKDAVTIINKFYKYIKRIVYGKRPHIQVLLKGELTESQKKKVNTLVTQKFKKNIPGGVKFYKNKFELRNFNYRSYGVIRKIVNSL